MVCIQSGHISTDWTSAGSIKYVWGVYTWWCSYSSIALRSIKGQSHGLYRDLELYFTHRHLMYSFQSTLFGKATATAKSQHLQPRQTRQLVVYQLVFSHQQPRGHQQHNPQRVRNTHKASCCTERGLWFVFFFCGTCMLWAFHDSPTRIH